nr:phage minor head protein [Enterovibrio nigricans]
MIPTDSWEYRQTEAAVKLRSFTIANVSGGEAINRVKKLYTQALEDGASKSETLQKLDGFMEQAGIAQANPYWLELHYRNNMMTAYNSGRWTQVANNDLVQYLVYSSVMDAGTTELCRHLDDVAKPKDDPFWEIYYPPNHHKCVVRFRLCRKSNLTHCQAHPEKNPLASIIPKLQVATR